ncbi:PEP-CTERM sorting domain-containing protein [Hankyongella ginsenosidimutans]|uniref:PEP-CTERM sorting domain-containing protein n=1 Tax=Hankyongella ginsenosidimutans TaxID=1763828 RepID=A0A4D7CAM4_9SPHN|nr:PEP-CTERM sorting domain-containing protein [Hankyongella ginsenosidimutans]
MFSQRVQLHPAGPERGQLPAGPARGSRRTYRLYHPGDWRPHRASPEPGSLIVLGAGLALAGIARRRR